jgi:hypothetical protein
VVFGHGLGAGLAAGVDGVELTFGVVAVFYVALRELELYFRVEVLYHIGVLSHVLELFLFLNFV